MMLNSSLYESLPYLYIVIGCIGWYNDVNRLVTVVSLLLIVIGCYFIHQRHYFRNRTFRIIQGKRICVGKKKPYTPPYR